MASMMLTLGLVAVGCSSANPPAERSGSSSTSSSTIEPSSDSDSALDSAVDSGSSTSATSDLEVEPLEIDLALPSWSMAGTTPVDAEVQISVIDFGAVPDDGGSDSTAFAKAVREASLIDGSVAITIPGGSFELTETLDLVDDVTLRGQGSATQIVVDFNNVDGPGISVTGTASPRWVAVQGEPLRGDVTLVVSNSGGFRPGDLIEIEQENDGEVMNTKPEWDVDWGDGSVGELNQVLAVDGNELTLEAPLNSDYRSDLAPSIRQVDAVEGVGIEDLSIFRRDDGYGSTIRFDLAADVWLHNVVSERTSRAHVGLNQVFRCRVEGSVFYDASDFGDGGRAYGISLARHTTGCLVLNNTLYDLRHAIIVQLGASGNVVAYNHATGSAGYEDRQPRADVSLHGHWPQANLFEGNIIDRVVSSDWWGPSGPANTLFRNCIRDHVILADQSNSQVVVGNVVGDGGIQIEENIKDSVVTGNLVTGEITGVGEAAKPRVADLPASLWSETPPEFLAGFAWPPIEPETTDPDCVLPSSERSPLGGG